MILSRSFPLRALLIALLPLVLSAACDKLPRNGALDGQWQLVRRNDADLTAQRIYWAVQLDLIQLRSPRRPHHFRSLLRRSDPSLRASSRFAFG